MADQRKPGESGQGAWRKAGKDVEVEGPYTTLDDLHRAAGRAERRYWELSGTIGRAEDRRFSEPEGFRYFWKPPGVTYGFGLPAVLLIVVQMWFPELNSALGDPAGEYIGLLRIAALFLGALLLFIAAPLYKPADWTPQQQQELDAAHEYFRNKRGM